MAPAKPHMAVACPQCHAVPGQTCRRYDGKGGPPHAARVALVKPAAPTPGVTVGRAQYEAEVAEMLQAADQEHAAAVARVAASADPLAVPCRNCGAPVGKLCTHRETGDEPGTHCLRQMDGEAVACGKPLPHPEIKAKAKQLPPSAADRRLQGLLEPLPLASAPPPPAPAQDEAPALAPGVPAEVGTDGHTDEGRAVMARRRAQCLTDDHARGLRCTDDTCSRCGAALPPDHVYRGDNPSYRTAPPLAPCRTVGRASSQLALL